MNIRILAYMMILGGSLVAALFISGCDTQGESSSHSLSPESLTGLLDSNSGMDVRFDYKSRKVLAEGPALIVGEIRADDRPVEGLKFRLHFLPDLNSEWLLTDASGRYALKMPSGSYEPAGYEFDRETADQILDGMVMLGSIMRPFPRPEENLMEAVADQQSKGPSFFFATALEITGPKQRESVPNGKVVFSWKPFDGADYYELKVNSRGKDGRKYDRVPLTYNPVEYTTGVKVSGSSVTQQTLNLNFNPGEYYTWTIRAFSSENRLLSASPHIDKYMWFYVE